MIFVGIDPGKAGAIACIDENGKATKYGMMPLLPSGEIDGKEVYRMLENSGDKVFCTLELAQAMPQQGVVSVFNYGRGFGKIQAAIEILKIPCQEVRPMAWKKEFSLVKTEKTDSVTKAMKLFPDVEFYTKRGRMLDGLAEAFLLALYGLKKSGRNTQKPD
jgi:crossover junction endodeoxyribonuclease RuvC